MKKIRKLFFIVVIGLIGFLSININVSADDGKCNHDYKRLRVIEAESKEVIKYVNSKTRVPSCPKGYSRIEQSYTCQKREFTGEYSCPDSSYSQPGGSHSGTCYKIKYINASRKNEDYYCPKGTKLKNNGKIKNGYPYVCKVTISTTGKRKYITKYAKMNVCPYGYEYKNGKCELKNLEYDVSKEKFAICPDGTRYSEGKCYYCPQKTYQGVIMGVDNGLNVRLCTKSCPEGYTEFDGTCVSDNFQDIKEIYECVEGEEREKYEKALNKTISTLSTTSSSTKKSSSSSSTNKTTTSSKSSAKKKVSITCPKSTFKVDEGKSKTIGVKIKNAKIKDAKVSSNNKKIATVKKIKKNGKSYIQVTGKKAGSTSIKIKVGSKSKTCKIKVNKKDTQTKTENYAENTVNEGTTDINEAVDAVTEGDTSSSGNTTTIKTIKCPSKTPSVKVGKTIKINYKVNPSDANTDNVDVIVKGGSKDNIKITSKNPLKVKGLKKGTGKIVFKYNGKTTTCKVKVEKASSKSTTTKKKSSSKKSNDSSIKKVTITGGTKISVGNKKTLIANVSPSKANQKVTWKSSNKKIATVDQNGQVTAIKAGKVTITATSKGNSNKKGSKKITILKAADINQYGPTELANSISIPQTKTITVDSRYKFKVIYSPENTSMPGVTWKSSNKKVVTVDSNGQITGHKTGTAIVTATYTKDSKITASCIVTVGKKINVKSVSVSPTKVTMYVGETKTIVKTISPSNVYNKAVTYKSSNKKVATVDSNGQIKAIKKGTATITATSRSDATKKATIKVTIKATPSSISSSPVPQTISAEESITLAVGNKTKLNITSDSGKISSKEFKFESSDSKKAIVDSDGTIIGKKVGTSTITITSKTNPQAKAICIVTITKKVNVSKIEITSQLNEVVVGDKLQLTSLVTPIDASNKNVTWKSSNTKVATVNSNGVVTGKKKGTVTITATSKSDTTKKATIKIKVTKANSNLEETNNSNNDITSSKWQTDENNYNTTTLKIGETIYVPWVEDGEFVSSDYTYTLTDTSVASIDATGKITALSVGTTYIKLIKNLDGSTFATLKIVVIEQSTTSNVTTDTNKNNTNSQTKTTSKLTYKNTKIWPVKDLVIYKNSTGSSSTGKKAAKGKTLKILDHKNKRFKITYNGTTGWISRSWVMIDMITFDKRLEYKMPNASKPIYYLKDNDGNDKKIAAKKLYKSKICALMYDTAVMLSKAQDKASKSGYTLVVYDAYRPQSVTKYLYSKASDMVGSGNKYNSPLGNLLAQNTSTHNYGVAVDITLKKDGKELSMPTKMHYIGTSAGNTNHNSEKLASIMTSVGFSPLKGSDGTLLEWWHFQNNSSNNYKVNVCNFNSNVN